ncbi:MAG: DUF1801 domain-containing protein [Leptospira sp.]|nr:DUF1801 domain-containing protein [Leptospira sp.]
MKTELEDFYTKLTSIEIKIVDELISILSDFPTLHQKFSYSVPYFFQKSRVCFVWPASIKSGPKSGVQLGFCNGYLLEDRLGILEKKGRKQVYVITYREIEDIRGNIIREYVRNALEVDDMRHWK